jgi:hypothetical protein
MLRRLLPPLLLVLFGRVGVAAGESRAERPFSLRQAIDSALRRNPGLGAKMEGVAASKARLRKTIGQQDWVARFAGLHPHAATRVAG